MIKKKIFSLSNLTLCAIFFMCFAFKGEKDPLHKRIFNINITEVKDGIVAKKSVMDKIEFKDGKLFSEFLFDKFQYKWLKYRINKDSIYTDSTDTEVRLLEVEATTTDDKDLTLAINFAVVEWDIEGTIKMTKSDKPKKFYDFSGFEKGGKPKKPKKPKKGEPIEGEQKQE
ncbi:MAG: hypothetical protein Q7W45_15885 [Bacteroidota bacterium]|nr:hypothetical protein [Bacteroidota bacterium]MDP3145504.1 hypothetical protein [Bacteroidota bacterium]MDP3556464.1 hypothetical protein [Bacteroidota bacterium]